MDQNDLQYDEGSLLDEAPDDYSLFQFREQMRIDVADFEYDVSYLNHIRRFHGGTTRLRWFRSDSGHEYAIEYFLNWISNAEARDDVGWNHVSVVSGLILERRADEHVPFASVFGGNYLCFDYSKKPRPSIVVWLNEFSQGESPVTEFVANTFDDLLRVLYYRDSKT